MLLKNIRKNWLKVVLIAVVCLVLLLAWYFGPGFSAGRPGAYYNKGENAVWLRHDWVGEPKSVSEIQELVQNLNARGIKTVFVHTGPLPEDGNIDPSTYWYAPDFLERAKKFDDTIEYQAWLGQIRSKLDLADSNVRRNVVQQAVIMARMAGFDGVHIDIEPVWDEDEDFIKLLNEIRDELPEDKKISVALAEFIPKSLLWLMENVHEFENYNSEVNYKNVAQYADQIVVMAYDTGISSPWLYRWLVKEQTIWLTRLLKGKKLFVGLPAYDEEKEGFDPSVENLKNGLRGVAAGLDNFRSNEDVFEGVAIYPYWEIDAEEWQDFETFWQ